MKKWIAALMTAVLLLSFTAVAGAQDGTGEVSPITVTYLTTGTTPVDLEKVQAAVNEITIPQIGVEVTLLPMSAYDALAQLSVQVAGGDDLDLIMLLLQNVKTWADQGLLEPVDALIAANAPYISDIRANTVDLCAGTYTNGEAYAINPVPQSYGASCGFCVAKVYLDEVGFAYDAERVYTLDELHELFVAIKEKHPDIYPNGTIAQGTGSMAGAVSIVHDTLGASTCSGVLMGKDSTQIVNLYATEEYADFVRTMRAWYEEGLTYPDAAVTSATVTELVASGAVAGYFIGGHPSLHTDAGEYEVVCLQTSEPFVTATGSTGSFWAIPITCSDKAAAMRFLDLTYSNHDLANLIMHGLEGEHYVMLDAEQLCIGFPEGVDGASSGYFNQLGLWGDRRYEYVWNPMQSQRHLSDYSERALKNQTKAVGYCYDMTNTLLQVTTIQSILAEYVRALETGSVDVETVLPEFIKRLDAAGINDVIADNQAQFDAWREAR